MTKRILPIVAVLAMYACAPLAFAQAGLPGVETALFISITPVHPPPHGAVHLEARSSIFDLTKSTIAWTVNGKSSTSGLGATSVDITAGDAAEETDVSVSIVAPDNTSANASAVIIPAGVDLLVDSNSYVPPFYRGAALPSAGTTLSLQAIPHFKMPDGTLLTDSQIDFTWKNNDVVLGDKSGVGRSSIKIPSALLYGTDNISVEATSLDGTISADASASLPSQQPILVLYEDHPLYGILYNRALDPSTFIPEAEMTFAAIPYYVAARGATDPDLQYAWRVNGSAVAADPKDPNEITINADKSTGLAFIELALTSATNFFLNISSSWSVGLSGSTPSTNPFTAGQQ